MNLLKKELDLLSYHMEFTFKNQNSVPLHWISKKNRP